MNVESAIHLYVNMPGHSPCFCTIADALSSLPAETPAEKQFPAPSEEITPVIIHIGRGVYREKLVITRPYVTLAGTSAAETILVYGLGACEIMPDGSRRGTFRTASVRIDTHDFTASRLTFQNDAGYGHTAGQALALYVDGDRCYFEDCRLIGSQDTLFTAPLPEKEIKPGGFTGPGENKPRIPGRHCYRNCYIQGDVDFIFGGGIAWFECCTVFSKMPADLLPPESPSGEHIYGFITAASTPEDQPFGYVLTHCRVLGDCPDASVYLGRPWREYAKTVYLHCELGPHIHPAGWEDWGKEHGHFYYGEYENFGPGAKTAGRAEFSHQLTQAQASAYTIENVLQGWLPAASAQEQ